MDRTILHCDLNGFYASVECLYRPELKNVPMAVGGNVENRHGIILAKNELAKGFGIVTAETVWQAKRKCPELVLVPPHRDRYSKYSRIVRAIYERYTDRVEPFGIDEAWLDVTGSMNQYGSGKQIADSIRETVKSETGLTISVGVSFNKVFAKLGSDYKKPDATTIISRDNYKKILFPLKANSMLFVGKSATAMLDKLGITTIGQLASSDRAMIADLLGKHGTVMHDNANGLDNSEVQYADALSEAKSVGRGMTFGRDLVGIEDIKTAILPLAEDVAVRLREGGQKCGAVQVTIRDPKFKTITRQRKLHQPTHLKNDIVKATIDILESQWDMDAPIRMLTITGISLVSGDEPGQLSIFDIDETASRAKWEKIEHAVDGIRQKYGKRAISLGVSMDKDDDKNEEDDTI
ncbi:MAG: DNA polymerase IV [Clostridia bacterium]|jgi:DNA polymerase IV|nr:DNA polymerase IV [Clostridia bacterium]